MAISRGQIYFVFLDPVFGRELGGYKTRPVVVLSVDSINGKPLAVTVVPGTSVEEESRVYPNVARITPSQINGLAKLTDFQCHQIRALDQGRFTGKSVGKLSSGELKKIEDSLKFVLGLT